MAKVLSGLGVNLIQFRDLDDAEAITYAASEHDNSATALGVGLRQRRATTGKEVYLLHTTGTSNIADKPGMKEYCEARILTDKDDLYTCLKKGESLDPYSQRTTDLVAIDTGLEVDVKTYLIMSPTIYGMGNGLFNCSSIQLPTLIRAALKTGQVGAIRAGDGVWDAVHIEDLALLYELLLSKVLLGEDILSGRKEIYFSETGDYTWMSLAQGIACEMDKQGALQTADVKQLTLEEGAKLWANNTFQYAELGYGSNSRSRVELSRELGWKPTRTRADFQGSFEEQVKKILAAERKQID